MAAELRVVLSECGSASASGANGFPDPGDEPKHGLGFYVLYCLARWARKRGWNRPGKAPPEARPFA